MKSKRAVIADDSAPFRATLLKLIATIPGITVIAEAQNGVEALEIVRDKAPDLLILDIRMPQMNGWEVLRELQGVRDRVRILMISGSTDEHIRRLALDYGASAYVAKCHVQLLIDEVTQLIQDNAVGYNNRFFLFPCATYSNRF